MHIYKRNYRDGAAYIDMLYTIPFHLYLIIMNDEHTMLLRCQA